MSPVFGSRAGNNNLCLFRADGIGSNKVNPSPHRVRVMTDRAEGTGTNVGLTLTLLLERCLPCTISLRLVLLGLQLMYASG